METELLTRDYQKPPSPKERLVTYIKNFAQNNKNVIAKFKNPKILTIIVLVLILLVVFLAIRIITSTNKKTQTFTPPQNVVVTQTATPTPNLSQVGMLIQQFNEQLGDNQSYSAKLKQPIVDLDLSLKK